MRNFNLIKAYKNNTIGNRLKFLLNYYQISMRQVSKKCGISQTTLSRISNDKSTTISLNILRKLSKFFKISLDWFIGE